MPSFASTTVLARFQGESSRKAATEAAVLAAAQPLVWTSASHAAWNSARRVGLGPRTRNVSPSPRSNESPPRTSFLPRLTATPSRAARSRSARPWPTEAITAAPPSTSPGAAPGPWNAAISTLPTMSSNALNQRESIS